THRHVHTNMCLHTHTHTHTHARLETFRGRYTQGNTVFSICGDEARTPGTGGFPQWSAYTSPLPSLLFSLSPTLFLSFFLSCFLSPSLSPSLFLSLSPSSM